MWVVGKTAYEALRPLVGLEDGNWVYAPGTWGTPADEPQRWQRLMEAVATNDLKLLNKLLSGGATVDFRGKDGVTPLMVAAFHARLEAVTILLDNRADINTTDDSGETALLKAASSGTADIVKLLLERGADVNVCAKKSGIDALMIASFNGHLEVVKLLLDKGASVSAKDIDGETALLKASASLINLPTSSIVVRRFCPVSRSMTLILPIMGSISGLPPPTVTVFFGLRACSVNCDGT